MRSIKKTSIAIVLSVAMLSLGGILFVPSATAAPTTFTVNVTTDEVDANAGDGICETANAGECTLRAAMEEANANVGADTIEFTIPGSGVHTIQPGSQLPVITEALTIDGYTNNPGASSNTTVSPAPMDSVINIELDDSLGVASPGLRVMADDVTIRGLAIDGFGQAIRVDGTSSADNITIEGNYLGTDSTGQTPNELGEADAVTLENDCSNIFIGGSNPEDRNIITGSSTGINIYCSNISIFGNYVGVGRDGISTIVGQEVETGGLGIIQQSNFSGPAYTDLIIGGPATGQANVISGSPGAELAIGGNGGIFQGNIVGGDYTGNENENIVSGAGISIHSGSSNNLVGGSGTNEGNIFVGTKGAAVGLLGVEIPLYSMNLVGQKNAILGNSIFEVGILDYYNIGNSNLGIDMLTGTYAGAPNGAPETYTDAGPNTVTNGNDTDKVNNYLRAPVLNSAVQVGDQLSLDFDLEVIGSDSNQYRVEFFANDTSTVFGTGPGQSYLGSTTVDTGNTAFDLTLGSSADITNKSLSATVTPVDSTATYGFGGTSEFAQNIEIGSATDFDADGVPDLVEDAAPNSGDGNDDGLQDSRQPTVSSYEVGSTYVTFVTQGCGSNGSVSSLNASTLDTNDTGFTYPFGLTDFSLNCSIGNTVDITKIIFTNDTADGYSVRKYRPNTHTFEEVTGSTVSQDTIGGQSALVLTYSMQDGGTLDDDGVANGIILDPVGLAAVYVSSTPGVSNPTENTTASGTLAATGANSTTIQAIVAISILLLGLGMVFATRNKKPAK